MELRDYLKVIRARKWIIVQAVVIVTLTSLVASLLQAPSYLGEAKVLVADRNEGAAIFGTALGEFTGQPERALQTQVQLIQLRPLAEYAIRELGLKTNPEALLARIEVSAVGQTNVVTIKVTDSDSKRAADIANALASAYVDWSRESKRESIKTAADEVQRRLDEARTQILELGRSISSQGKSDELAAELQIVTSLYGTLAEKLETLRVNEQLEVGSGRLVSPAVVDTTPVSPKPLRNTILGMAVGLVFGVGMAFLIEYLDSTIKSTEEAEKLYGAPVLGQIPLEVFEKNEKRRLTIVQHPGSPAAESYRVLRNSLDFINFEHDIKALLVTSSAPGEGKSTVAANLAVGLAQTGKKVVLVNSDFRRPTTNQFFEVNDVIGLSDVLTGAHSLKSALQRIGDEQLLVLTAGKMPPNPSELLGSSKMSDLIKSLEDWADWIIIDSPPLLAVADSAAIARWVDGVLFVTRGGTSTRDAARKGRELLDKVGARSVGVAVWGLEQNSSGYDYYGDYYGGYYGGYYGASGTGRSKGRPDSGAKSVSLDSGLIDERYVAQKSSGRKVAEFIGRAMAGVLTFVVVLALLLIGLYFADDALGWGVVPSLLRLLGLG